MKKARSPRVSALVLTGFGLNCDLETAYALEMAGASARRVHINALIGNEVLLEDYDILVFGGGFSWGDNHGAGVVQTIKIMTYLGDRIRKFIGEGRLVIGICNGFQTLVNTGLLPGFSGDYTKKEVALLHNDCGNFRDQWVDLLVEDGSPCVFAKGLKHFSLPVRHGEGKFYASPETILRLEENKQVVLRYADEKGEPSGNTFPQNPNGSLHDIAGICDATGRVLGLMPHPEAYIHQTNHPDWTRMKAAKSFDPKAETPGITLFKNAVAYFE